MGIHDRDYNRESYGIGGPTSGSGSGGMLFRSPGWTVTTWLIVINVAMHLLAVVVLPNVLYNLGHLSVFTGFQRLEVWRLLTFQFLHDPNSIWHLAFNMFGLWVFGPFVEDYLGRKKYLAFYLMCGLCGGVLFIILSILGHLGVNLPGVLHSDLRTPLIGASAGVFGVIVACAYISPNTIIQLLFPPIPLKMKYLAYGYVGLALFNLLTGSSNAGGEAAHIGGAIAGFYFIRNSKLLADFFDVMNDSRKPKQKPKPKRKNKYDRGRPSQEEIDRILDKVNASGLASLTEREKRTLAQASKDDD
jgi:membrane associated rhomboid family serine protease